MAYANKAALKADALAETLRSELDFDNMVWRAEEYLNSKLLPVRAREVAGVKFALVSDSDTNWLLQNAPNAYRLAVVVEVWKMAQKFDEAAMFKQMLDDAIDDIAWESARADSQNTLTIDPALVVIGPARGYDIATDGLSGDEPVEIV